MGNNSDQRRSTSRFSQQVLDESPHDLRGNDAPISSAGQRLAIDSHEAFERSYDRGSGRARSERTDYSVTNDHLNLNEDEDEQLVGDPRDLVNSSSQYSASSASSTSHRDMTSKSNISDHPNQVSPSLKKVNKKSRFEPTFLDNLNRALAASPPVVTTLQSQQTYDFEQETKEPKGKRARKKYGKHMVPLYNSERGGNVAGSGDSQGRFRQTYTELSSPMKTSPAFDYILRDTERRNKRYCMWFIYSILTTLCIAMMIFAIVHLVLRHQSSTL